MVHADLFIFSIVINTVIAVFSIYMASNACKWCANDFRTSISDKTIFDIFFGLICVVAPLRIQHYKKSELVEANQVMEKQVT